HLENGKVGLLVRADDLRFKLIAILERNRHFTRVVDNVVVGDDVALRIDEEARPKGVALLVLLRHALFLVLTFTELVFVLVEARQAAEWIEGAVALRSLHFGGNLDADDGGTDPLDQVSKAHGSACGRRDCDRFLSCRDRRYRRPRREHSHKTRRNANPASADSSNLHHSLSLTAFACATAKCDLDAG